MVRNNHIHVLQLGRMGKRGKETWPVSREEEIEGGERMERGRVCVTGSSLSHALNWVSVLNH